MKHTHRKLPVRMTTSVLMKEGTTDEKRLHKIENVKWEISFHLEA